MHASCVQCTWHSAQCTVHSAQCTGHTYATGFSMSKISNGILPNLQCFSPATQQIARVQNTRPCQPIVVGQNSGLGRGRVPRNLWQESLAAAGISAAQRRGLQAGGHGLRSRGPDAENSASAGVGWDSDHSSNGSLALRGGGETIGGFQMNVSMWIYV